MKRHLRYQLIKLLRDQGRHCVGLRLEVSGRLELGRLQTQRYQSSQVCLKNRTEKPKVLDFQVTDMQPVPLYLCGESLLALLHSVGGLFLVRGPRSVLRIDGLPNAWCKDIVSVPAYRGAGVEGWAAQEITNVAEDL
jgi:hypothetical protein